MKKIFCIFCLNCFFLIPLFSLKIYRPVNNGQMNDIRCFLRILDENDNDVTYTCGKVFYAWVNKPKVFYSYKKQYYLLGGMVLHIYLKPGKYKFSIYTPPNEQQDFPCDNKNEWISNILEYNTENPTNVIFINPTANENVFYNGGWNISYYAPKFYKYTKPKIITPKNY